MEWKQQSPINIEPSFTLGAPKDYLCLSCPPLVNGRLEKDQKKGLTIRFVFAPNQYVELEHKRFYLQELHFHRPSEHLLGAQAFDGELHLVFQNPNDLMHAVFCIFLSKGQVANDVSDGLDVALQKKKKIVLDVAIDIRRWLPQSTSTIFRYEGSLTTDPFGETVSWIVFEDPKRISTRLFDRIFAPNEWDARELQTRDRRYVVKLENLKIVDCAKRRATS